jgi:hypothetical protein
MFLLTPKKCCAIITLSIEKKERLKTMIKARAQRAKEIIKNVIIIIAIVIIFCWCSWDESHYTREATVIGIIGNTVTVMDECGYTWAFEGNDFNVNDKVKLMMSTMHTDSNIFDDKIEDVKMINE